MPPRPSPWSTGSRTSPAAPAITGGVPKLCSATRPITPTSTAENSGKRRILPVISRKGALSSKGLGQLRCVIEQTFALLHHCKRLAFRWERRTELRDAFVSLACSLT